MLIVTSSLRDIHAHRINVLLLVTLLVFALMIQHGGLVLTADVVEKRIATSGIGGTVVGPGQPEEIFTLDNRLESNYDEYPMVVPKRAALLLDRLMVALHHALEKERRKIGDFYDESKHNHNKHLFKQQQNKNKNNDNQSKNDYGVNEITGGGDSGSLMYSDDDPNVMLDYDFKDLHSINRPTGQTLENNFQRRGHGGILLEPGFHLDGNRLALLHTPTVAGTKMSSVDDGYIAAAITKLNDNTMVEDGGTDTNGGSSNNIGRMYWRCYFNAVSCF